LLHALLFMIIEIQFLNFLVTSGLASTWNNFIDLLSYRGSDPELPDIIPNPDLYFLVKL